jgi:hypothetical protein
MNGCCAHAELLPIQSCTAPNLDDYLRVALPYSSGLLCLDAEHNPLLKLSCLTLYLFSNKCFVLARTV